MSISHDSLFTRATRVAEAIRHERFGKGELAALRRLNVLAPAGTAFTRAVMLWEGADEALRDENETVRVAAFVFAIARTPSTDASLGDCLARAGYSDTRLERLLRAEGNSLAEEVVLAACFLEAKGQGVRAVDMASLLFVHGAKGATVRLGIARQFFRKASASEEGVIRE